MRSSVSTGEDGAPLAVAFALSCFIRSLIISTSANISSIFFNRWLSSPLDGGGLY
jgi:hypothetical protein